MDGDEVESLSGLDSSLANKPANGQVVEMLRRAQPPGNQRFIAMEIDLNLGCKRRFDAMSSEVVGDRGGEFDVVRPLRFLWGLETQLCDVLKNAEFKESIRGLDPP